MELIKEFECVASIHGEANPAAGNFNTPKACWFTKTSPAQFFNFVHETHVRGWTQHVANPTRENNIFDLAFTHDLPNVDRSVLDNFPGSDTKMVSCFLHICPQTPNTCNHHPVRECLLQVGKLGWFD